MYDAAVAADPFAFAEVNARTVADARAAREGLAKRLGVGDEEHMALLRATPAWEALLTYCIEGPLNIEWYDRRIASWRHRQRGFIGASVVITTLVVGLLVWRNANDSTIAQLSAAVAALVACVRILAGASDVKTQLGGFWRARADLKEQFLTFEQAWRGHVLGEGKVAEGFETALWQEITNARHVVRAERDTYFSTFATPSDALGAATGGLDAIFGRARELEAARLGNPRAQAVAEARKQLDQAKADRAAHERMMALLVTRPTGMSEGVWRKTLEDAATGHATAEADIARYTELLKAAAKAATLNPS
jgi:hypothetical protein